MVNIAQDYMQKRESVSYSILVAEDDKIIRRLARHILERAGYVVHEATDGLEALAQVKAQKPDLLLLDIMMPNMNGYDVCQTLRSQQETADLPIVIITAKTEKQAVQRGLDVGANRYLIKPISPKVLVDNVNDILGVSPVTD